MQGNIFIRKIIVLLFCNSTLMAEIILPDPLSEAQSQAGFCADFTDTQLRLSITPSTGRECKK
jgi:hypothetical protein